MRIPRIGRVITIWDKIFFKLGMYFDVLVSRKKVFLESSHFVKTNFDMVVEVIEVQNSVYF